LSLGDLFAADVRGHNQHKMLSQAKRGLSISGGAIPCRLLRRGNRRHEGKKFWRIVWPESSVEVSLLGEVAQSNSPAIGKRLANLDLLESESLQ
jgi:hypothetical protein